MSEKRAEYRRRFRKIWLWADWPGTWAADAGIDLVAEEQDGGLWAGLDDGGTSEIQRNIIAKPYGL